MGGFKRATVSKTNSSDAKKPRQERGGGARRRGRGARASTGGKRGRKRNSDEEEEAEEEVPARKHMLYDDDEDDIQAGYREEGGTVCGEIWIPPKYTRQAHEMKGERLIIDMIVCENFKSYGGVKEMGPFHKSFSAIVGPNGNGKSNIIDAMLFVFGYRSTKIRCKKTSTLIHQSELLPNVESCAVTVHFVKVLDDGVDDDAIVVVPDSKISVTRRVDKKCKSVYLLGEKPCSFQEVAAFLKTNGVDIVHNRFLILQGEVESISQMPPKRKNQHETGLLEFLEEVIGTKRYAKCLSELEIKVSDLNFERERKLHAVDIVEQEKRNLKEPVQKAKDFLRAQNGLFRDKHTLYQHMIYDTRTDFGSCETEKKEAEARFGETMKQLEEINEVNSEREKACCEKDKAAKALENEQAKLQKSIDVADSQFTKIKEQIQRSNTQRKKTIKEITTSEKELEELEQIPINSEKQLKDLEKRKQELDSVIGEEEEVVEKEMKQLDKQVDKVSKEKEGTMKTFMDLKKIRDEKKQKNDALQSELKVIKEQEGAEKRKLENMVKELEELKEKIKMKEREARSSAGNRVAGLETSIQQKNADLETLLKEEKVKKIEMENKRSVFDAAREIVDNSNTNDVTYKAFFAEKAKGNLQGLYGRLRDLGTIDEKYNVAVTVATSLWDHWVVDTDTTATEAINLLRQQNLQYQNFICLNKMLHYNQTLRRTFKAPARSQRLFDLVKLSKPELATAFYKALRDTLVTDDLEIGSEIAYGAVKHRVTTINGELIEPSGQMTGGGRQKIFGKMNTGMAARLERTISQSEFRALKDEATKSIKVYEELFTRRQELEGEIRTLSLKLRDIQSKFESSKTDVESMKNQIKLKEKRLTEQEQKVKEVTVSPSVIADKEKHAAKAETEYENASGPCEEAGAEAKKVEDKLRILQGEKKKAIRRKLDTALDQKKKVVDDFDKYSVALKNYSKNHEKLEKKLENLQKNKTRLEVEMRELDEKKKELTSKGIKVIEEMGNLKEGLEKARKEFQELKKSLSEFTTKRSALEKDRVTLENDLTNATAKFKGITSRVDSIKGKIGKLELSSIPEEDVHPFKTLSDEELENLDIENLQVSIEKMSGKLKREQPNLGVLEQYKIKMDEFMEKVQELDGVTMNRDKFRNAYISTIAQRLSEFMEGFAVISSKLKEMFRMISMGGDAELELVDSTDPFSFGVNICVRPARKSWKKIIYLSGGEKTLASLALIFALHQFKPSPFYVMDEIDAALDFKNVSIIANYIKDRTKFTQFIIISLRSNMFELADSMLGVYKVDNMSYSIHIGIGKLLSQLRTKFLELGRHFPLENDFQQNNRTQRRLDIERLEVAKKQKVIENNLFNASFSLIDEEDEEREELSQNQPLNQIAPLIETVLPPLVAENSQTSQQGLSQGVENVETQLITVQSVENNQTQQDPIESKDTIEEDTLVREEIELETPQTPEPCSYNETQGIPEEGSENDEHMSIGGEIESEIAPETPEVPSNDEESDSEMVPETDEENES